MKIWRKIFFVIIAFFSLGLLSPAYAQFGEELGENIELGNTSPLDLAINIINWALGILALVAVVIILYGGFVWLTSAGNEERLAQAKRILRNGVIGLVIILSAWGITYYVLNTLLDLTGGEVTTTTGGGPGDGVGGTSNFYITAVDPNDAEEDVSLCHIIQVFFNLEVVESTVTTDNFCVYPEGSTCEDGVTGDFAFPESGQGFVFYPDEDYLASTVYHVELTTDIQGVDEDLVAYALGYTDPYLDFSFTTGTETDTVPPYVDVTDFTPIPADGDDDACLNTVIKVTFSESLDSASLNDENVWLYNGSTPSDELDVQYIATMNRGGSTADTLYTYPETTLTAFTDYGLSLYSGDADGVGAIKDTCGNPLDGDYDGTAEGSTEDDFIDPADAAATINGDWVYPWNFTTGENASCVPVIDSFTPSSGYYNDSVTISGLYLDQYTDINFHNGISAATTSCFDADYQVTSGCIVDDSSDETLIVQTPVASQTGQLSVEGPDGTGTSASDYTVSSPYVSRLSPSTGPVAQSVSIKGVNFGDYDPTVEGSTRGTVYFRDFVSGTDLVADFPCDDGWDDTQIIVTVPEGVDLLGDLNVQVVTSDSYYSNYRDFTYEDGTPGPTLCEINPSCSEDGNENIYLSGVGLSDAQGYSYFYNYSLDTSAEANISAWDSATGDITLTSAPSAYISTLGEFNVVTQNNDGSESNGLDFEMPCTDAPNVVQTSSCRPDEDAFPLPNPYLNEDEACRNSAVIVGFDQAMNEDTFTSDNIAIYKCSSDESYDSTTCDTTNLLTTSLIDEDYVTSGDYDGFKIENFGFEASYWYQVNLSTNVLADTGVGLTSDYSWQFRIRELDEDCEADYVNLSQSHRDFNTFDQLSFDTSDYTSWQDFAASPYTVECIVLNSGATSWVISDAEDTDTATTNEIVSFNNDLTLSASETTSNGDNNIYMMGDTDDVNEGSIYLRATVDGGAYDTAPVSVDFGYCETTAACESICPGSTCDLEAHKCLPVVNRVSPDDGGEGSCVTISGCFFGNEQGDGEVYLNDSNEFSYPVNPNCDSWEDEQIVAKVPNLATGEYTLTVHSAYGVDTASGTAFEVNEEERPCLCSAEPNQGEEGGDVILYGEDFGLYTEGTSAVSFYSPSSRVSATIDDDEAGLPDWQDDAIDTSIPAGSTTGLAEDGNDGVYMVDSNGTASNPLDFSVTCNQNSDCGTGCCNEGVCSDTSVCNACYDQQDCTDEYAGCYGDCVEGTCEPYIASVSPDAGDTGQPVTLSGCYFGEPGTVSFDEDEAGLLCGSSWSNIEIIAETPDSANWGSDSLANVSLTNDGALTSNSIEFDLDNSCTGYAYPILCELYDDNTNNPYGPYEGDLWFEGENFADLDEQYCLCSNTDSDETCSVAVGNDTCSGDNTCTLDAVCTENREDYDSTTETCACYNDAEELVCAVVEDESSCDYEFECEMTSNCETDSDTYQSVGGYIDYPGSGLFSDTDYAAAYLGRGPTQLDTQVPAYDSGATSGDVYVGTQDTDSGQSCNSNGLNFDITCSSCSDVPDGQHCDLSYGEGEYGRATSLASGYCQDYPDSCCGSTGCVIDETTSLGTCTERPSIVSVAPADSATDICLNAAVSVTFSEYMTYSGNIGASEHINLKVGGISGAEVDTVVTTTDDTTFTLTMADGSALSGNTTYYIEVISSPSDETGMVSTDSGLAVDQERTYYTSFTTANTADACPIDVVEIEATSSTFSDAGYILNYEGETQNLKAVAYSDDDDTCICQSGVESCEVALGDEECYFDDGTACELTDGHCNISSSTYDDNKEELRSIEDYYSWVWSWSPDYNETPASDADCDISGIYTSAEGYDATDETQTVIAGSTEGDMSITATATASYGWGPDSVDGHETIYVDFCPDGYSWSYYDSKYRLRLKYCRSDEGDSDTALPALQEEPTVIEVGSDAMYELLFTFESDSGNEDAIGLRVYPNNIEDTNTTHIDAVSPELWYQTFFESEDSVSTTTIDGWPAAQVGRSTYIAAANQYRGNIYPNIYLLSYSQDASADTQSVVSEILNNIKISTNVDSACGGDDSDKQDLIRDTERLTEIGTMAYYLGQYYDTNSSFPALTTGSYIQGMSTSKWPSWQATLANDLGYASPEDPYNTFDDDSCTSDLYETDTCWNDTDKTFSGVGDYYLYISDGSTYDLYANLEYTDGNWDSTVSDPCTSPSTCDSFNYQLNSSTYEAL